jgi:hypothetical protein
MTCFELCTHVPSYRQHESDSHNRSTRAESKTLYQNFTIIARGSERAPVSEVTSRKGCHDGAPSHRGESIPGRAEVEGIPSTRNFPSVEASWSSTVALARIDLSIMRP